MKKATDLEQETWVMHVPHYIAEISIFMAIWPFFWQNEPHIDKEFGVKKAMDLEQETWVMHVPGYIAEISFFGKMLWRQHPVLQGVYLNMMCIHYTGSPLHMQWRHY